MRTKGASHDETKQRILKAARALVLKHGHGSLSLREIARRTDFVPASLYEYFDGKDAILAALSRAASASLKLALERAENKDLSSAQRLEALGLAYVSWAKQHPEDFMLLFSRLPSKRASLQEQAGEDSPYRVVLDAVKQVAEEQKPPIRDRQEVEYLAYGLWASAHGMAMLQLTHLASFKADFATADRKIFHSLLRGYLR